MNLETIRNPLVLEAKHSPNLFSDLAGLESYIAESYNNRSFIELLQNADDAGSSKFKIIRDNNLLFVANNGRTFNEKDLESLCRSASSNKVRGETIGYRGIGFKSVVGFAKEIHLISGDYEITFSKEKTKLDVPEATRVPLIRIPHQLSNLDNDLLRPTINKLYIDGYSTIFVFTDIVAQEIQLEFDSFDASSLMFLRNINELEIRTSESLQIKIFKEKISDSDVKLTFKNNNSTSEWLLCTGNNIAIAYFLKDNKVQKLPEIESLIYAFLPTEDICGLGVLINGDFSTDPSRKHLIYDSRTIETIKFCSEQILEIIERNLSDYNIINYDIINALIPYIDPRMVQFKKTSFEKLLLEDIKNSNSKLFDSLRLCPSWLNVKDFSILTEQDERASINYKYFSIEGFISFAKYLGAKEYTFENLIERVNLVELSTLGYAQFSVQIFKCLVFGSLYESDIKNLELLICNKEKMSINDLKNNGVLIDNSFISLLIENGLTEFDIKHVLKKHISEEYSEKLFPTKNDTVILTASNFPDSFSNLLTSTQEVFSPTKGSVARWRSAEEITLEILNQNGFSLEDVSKQNVGYDLEGKAPNGSNIQLEIKSITYPGQQFRITNNEIAVAQDKQDSYYIAIVRQIDDFFEIALVPNPVKNLKLNRQCVQWIWECSEYEYKPLKFEM